MKKPKRRKRTPRSHLPSLSPAQRELIALRLQANPVITPAVSQAVMASINAAANKDAETPDVVIESLDPAEKASVKSAMPGYSAIFGGVGARGRNRLVMDMEIDQMIQDEADA